MTILTRYRHWQARRYYKRVNLMLFGFESALQYKHRWTMEEGEEMCATVVRRRFGLPEGWKPE